MRTNVNNRELPGVQSEASTTAGPDTREVFYRGEYVGTVIYAGRQRARGGTDYGWRPYKSPRARLTTQVDAIRALPNYQRALTFEEAS